MVCPKCGKVITSGIVCSNCKLNLHKEAVVIAGNDARNQTLEIMQAFKMVENFKPVTGNPNYIDTLFRSAEEGDPEAQYRLGAAYERGVLVKKSEEDAVYWYKKAAEQGERDAQFCLGWANENGELGLNMNKQEALKWYLISAEHGQPIAQYNLGMMYDNGVVVNKDYNEALKWLILSAEQGFERAQEVIGFHYVNGDGVQKDYKEAIKWLSKAAEKNSIQAQAMLGYMYEHGMGVEKNKEEAQKWYKRVNDNEEYDDVSKAWAKLKTSNWNKKPMLAIDFLSKLREK